MFINICHKKGHLSVHCIIVFQCICPCTPSAWIHQRLVTSGGMATGGIYSIRLFIESCKVMSHASCHVTGNVDILMGGIKGNGQVSTGSTIDMIP